MENQFNTQQQKTNKNTNKSKNTFKSKSKDYKVGEYIDYEEIE